VPCVWRLSDAKPERHRKMVRHPTSDHCTSKLSICYHQVNFDIPMMANSMGRNSSHGFIIYEYMGEKCLFLNIKIKIVLMNVMEILNWVLMAGLVALSVWVYQDASARRVEKRWKWALLMLLNPFALKKYMKLR